MVKEWLFSSNLSTKRGTFLHPHFKHLPSLPGLPSHQWLSNSYPPLHPECHHSVGFLLPLLRSDIEMPSSLVSGIQSLYPGSRTHIPKHQPDPSKEVTEYSGPTVRQSRAQVYHLPTVNVSKLLILSTLQFPHLQNIGSIFKVVVRIQRANTYCANSCLQHGKRVTNVSRGYYFCIHCNNQHLRGISKHIS